MSFPNSNKSSTMARPLESTPSAEQRVIVLDSQEILGGSSLPPTSSVSSSVSSTSSQLDRMYTMNQSSILLIPTIQRAKFHSIAIRGVHTNFCFVGFGLQKQ